VGRETQVPAEPDDSLVDFTIERNERSTMLTNAHKSKSIPAQPAHPLNLGVDPTAWIAAVAIEPSVTHASFRVGYHLAHQLYSPQAEQLQPTIKALARLTFANEITVIKAVCVLEALGYLHCERFFSRHRPNLYFLKMPEQRP
jgi:hypothetical protein